MSTRRVYFSPKQKRAASKLYDYLESCGQDFYFPSTIAQESNVDMWDLNTALKYLVATGALVPLQRVGTVNNRQVRYFNLNKNTEVVSAVTQQEQQQPVAVDDDVTHNEASNSEASQSETDNNNADIGGGIYYIIRELRELERIHKSVLTELDAEKQKRMAAETALKDISRRLSLLSAM